MALYEGPGSPTKHRYLVREVAAALVAIGGGESYTAAAQHTPIHARGAGHRRGRHRDTDVNGSLVAE